MKKLILPGIVFMFLIFATTAGAAVFTVTPTSDNDCSDFNCDLQSALTAAASNGQDDTINIAAGTYTATSALTYLPTAASAENFALTIIGAGTGTTIVDGGSNAQVLNIDTTLLANGSLATITIKDLTITGSGDVKIATNAPLTVPIINAGSVTVSGGNIQLTGSITATGEVTLNTATPAIAGTGVIIAGGNISICPLNYCVAGNIIPPGLVVTVINGSTPVVTPGTLTLLPQDINIIAWAGRTVTLNAAQNFTQTNVSSKGWKQISGSPVTLSDYNSFTATFVVPPVHNSFALLVFEHTALDNFGNLILSRFNVSANDNGITDYPTAAMTFKSATNENLGLQISSGAVTSLIPVDPVTLTNNTNKPSNTLYGLLDMQIKVGKPGDTATVTVFLPAPAPAGYTWFKYNSQRGWYDFSDNAVFNADRTQVTLTLVDGGIGDDDGVANGVIRDPSGLASGSSASTGGGGCFIATAAYGSILHPHVATLRAYRDTFLLTNPIGEAFVKLYYRYSPAAADFIARHDTLRFIVRVCLIPAIALSWIALESGSAALSLLLLLSVLMLCAGFTYKCCKRKLPVCVK